MERGNRHGVIYNIIDNIDDNGNNTAVHRWIWWCGISGCIRRCYFMCIVDRTYHSPFYQEEKKISEDRELKEN